MAEVKPFRGVRYVSASLDQTLCPPYDVIGAELVLVTWTGRVVAMGWMRSV